MNVREKAKQETRRNVLQAAKEEFVENGLLNISTVNIARRAGVAHGTLFFHFQNKETLLIQMIDQELLQITDELYARLHGSSDFEDLLNTYLDFLEREERFFAIIARETPFYPPELRRMILGREAAIREYFYRSLQQEIEQGHYKEVDITITLSFLFGTLNYYLSLRESFIDQGSVIAHKRRAITATFMDFLSK